MLPVLPTMEFVVDPAPSTVTELVTLDWLPRMTEPALPGEVFGETVLPSRVVMLPGETLLPSRDVIVPDETVLPSRETIVLDVPCDTSFWARTLVHRPNATSVTSRFISALQTAFAMEVWKHVSGQRTNIPQSPPAGYHYATRRRNETKGGTVCMDHSRR